VDWAIPQTLGQTFTRDDAKHIIAFVTEQVEQMACCCFVVWEYSSDGLSLDVTCEQPDENVSDGWGKSPEPW